MDTHTRTQNPDKHDVHIFLSKSVVYDITAPGNNQGIENQEQTNMETDDLFFNMLIFAARHNTV